MCPYAEPYINVLVTVRFNSRSEQCAFRTFRLFALTATLELFHQPIAYHSIHPLWFSSNSFVDGCGCTPATSVRQYCFHVLATHHSRDRSRTLRPLRRPLRPRNADGSAARTRARLRNGEIRCSFPGEISRPAEKFRGPANATAIRVTFDRASRRAENLSQTRRLTAHRRAQNQ